MAWPPTPIRPLEQFEPEAFTKVLGAAEVALGTALILPIVPSRLAGLGLGAFSAGLLGLYLRTPGLRQEGSLRPSPDGTAIAKDVWMAGIALSLIIDSRVTKLQRQRTDAAGSTALVADSPRLITPGIVRIGPRSVGDQSTDHPVCADLIVPVTWSASS